MVLPYKSDGGACRKISRTPLNGTRILFYERVANSFPPLRGIYQFNNKKLYNWHKYIFQIDNPGR